VLIFYFWDSIIYLSNQDLHKCHLQIMRNIIKHANFYFLFYLVLKFVPFHMYRLIWDLFYLNILTKALNLFIRQIIHIKATLYFIRIFLCQKHRPYKLYNRFYHNNDAIIILISIILLCPKILFKVFYILLIPRWNLW